MASQITFFEKNKADSGANGVTVMASQGAAYASYALNRSNLTGWITTNSVDADNTTFTVSFSDAQLVNTLLLVKHNFKNFKVEYSVAGGSYQDFSPAINVTNNSATTNRYSITQVAVNAIRITITGTQTANADKYLYQFIATNLIGKLKGWPVISNPTHSRNRKTTQMLSGKLSVIENVGGFTCELKVAEWRDASDLSVVEALYNSNEGFLVWLSGGDEAQFLSARQGYRLEDIYLMKPINEYQPEFVKGTYRRGMDISIKLAEVVN